LREFGYGHLVDRIYIYHSRWASRLPLIDPKRQDLEPLLLASEMRRLVREMRPLLGEAGWGQSLLDDKPFLGEEYFEVFYQDVMGMLEQLNR